ncbi:MAG: RHS repeat-associated core domain-containing protein, partial [Phycisphaerales bacterium JB065]
NAVLSAFSTSAPTDGSLWNNAPGMIGYGAGIYDELAGLYLFRNRYYAPYEGRWITRDPAGYVDGMNLYQYVQGNPLIYFDPFGEWKWLRNTYKKVSRAVKNEVRTWTGALSTSEGRAAVARGAATGGKAVVNAGATSVANAVTLGQAGPVQLITPTAQDMDNGYAAAYGVASVGTEIATGLITGGVAKAGSTVGKAVAVSDAASNGLAVGGAASDMIENGVTVENSLQAAAGLAGMRGQTADTASGVT